MNKKAIAGDMWLTLGKAVLAAIIILATFNFITNKIGKSILGDVGSQEDQATKTNFIELTIKIQELLNNPRSTIEEKDFPYFLGKDFALVGISKSKDTSHIKIIDDFLVIKPPECYNIACLCLFKYNSEQTRSNQILPCKEFEENVFFSKKDYNWILLGNDLEKQDKIFTIKKTQPEKIFYISISPFSQS
jgi:hypothetical protein